MPRDDNMSSRRLSTPGRQRVNAGQGSRKSRSRVRHGLHGHRSRMRSESREAHVHRHEQSQRELEYELERGRARVRELENKVRGQSELFRVMDMTSGGSSVEKELSRHSCNRSTCDWQSPLCLSRQESHVRDTRRTPSDEDNQHLHQWNKSIHRSRSLLLSPRQEACKRKSCRDLSNKDYHDLQHQVKDTHRSRSLLRITRQKSCEPDAHEDISTQEGQHRYQHDSRARRLSFHENRYQSSNAMNASHSLKGQLVDRQDGKFSTQEKRGPHACGKENDQRVPSNLRSDSPIFTSKDIADILNTIGRFKSKPTTVATSFPNVNHKNILPDFDPSSKKQRIDTWLKKVNECATVYGWDETVTIHFAMQKLQGLAKTWYESLNSILFSWAEWQQKLLSAFPFEQNYGQSLEDMLRRKSRPNEPLEVYYYEKLALLNQCNVEGKNAVDCIIHGLSDKTMRSSANALRCTHPDQLLPFLMCNKSITQLFEHVQSSDSSMPGEAASNTKSRYPNTNSSLSCYNCKEIGHPYSKCPKPIHHCTKCRRIGHKTENCVSRLNDTDNVPKIMRISTTGINSKFTKEINVNSAPTKSFVDLGSEV